MHMITLCTHIGVGEAKRVLEVRRAGQCRVTLQLHQVSDQLAMVHLWGMILIWFGLVYRCWLLSSIHQRGIAMPHG